MAKISLDLIKQLREQTQVGMMDCKKALIEAGGNFETAVELLRKKGAAVALKRAGNETKEGIIVASVSEDGLQGALAQINCETDFSANTDDMRIFAQTVATVVLEKNPSSVSDGDTALMSQTSDTPGMTVQDLLDQLISKISEKITVTRFARLETSPDGMIHTYIHPGAHLGVIAMLKTSGKSADHAEQLQRIAQDVCMHIAVTNPSYLDPSQIPSDALEKERALIAESIGAAGKPAELIEKIVSGKIVKFYEQSCLLHQKFIKDEKMSIQEYLKQAGTKLGIDITIANFDRFSIGK